MFPGYGNMDPYTQHLPHVREHIPSPYHYYPNWEPTPLQMKTDSFNHPSPSGPWPYNNQLGHHNCCNHSYPPGHYSFGPPYFHYQHPPQMFYNGPYHPYPGAYPPFFMPPQFDHARFEYDKEKNHCCGCPNHIPLRKEGSNVKIEEQKDTPTIDEGSTTIPKGHHQSLIQFPYSHYPMMESLPILNFKDNLKDLRQRQGEGTHQENNKVLQLPYPIFWMSGNDKPEQHLKDKKEIDTTTKAAENRPSMLKIVPLKLLDNENPAEEGRVGEESEKESKIKTIPVMHLDSSNGEKLSMSERPKDILKADEKKQNAATKKDAGKKQSSPPKTSKLPPVCLRVEPLPKKNGSNGKDRSPSPPSLKERVKTHVDSNRHTSIMNNDSEKTPIKDVNVIDIKYKPSGEGMEGIENQCDENERKDATVDVGVQVKGNVVGNKEEIEDLSLSQEQKIGQNGEKVDTSDDNNKQMRKNYSPGDAALLIQSAFRGFNVRRWKPLEKLRKIAQIRGKVIDVKNQIQNDEVSLELNMKQKVILSETIMNLLLQLDTIQGLLPSLREVRKSVARDLVYLQDKLDKLYSQATIKHEEIQKKNENSNPNSAASDITSASDEQICLPSGSHMKEKNMSEQPSPYLEKNVFAQVSWGSSTACEHGAAVSDKTSCAIIEDEVQEPVCPSHVIPITVLNDEMVPSKDEYYQAPQLEDEIDSQADNISSAEAKTSIDENSVSQDADQSTNCKEIQAFNEQDLNDKHENPLEQQIIEEELMVVNPNEANKQSSVEDGVDIKPNEVIDERDDKAIEEASNVMGDASVVSEELKPVFNEGGRSEKCQAKEESEMNESTETEAKLCVESVATPIQSNNSQKLAEVSSGIVEEETQILSSVKEDSETNESAKIATELCIEFVATPFQNNNSQGLPEASSEIPAVETSSISPTDQTGIDSLDVYEPRIVPEATGETGLKELSFKEKKLVMDDEKLREMLEKLLHAGEEQMGVIADLNERVKNLERKLSKRKKVKVNQKKLKKYSHSVSGHDRVLSDEQIASSAA